MPHPFGQTQHAVVTVVSPVGAADDTAGVDIKASAAGGGVLVHMLQTIAGTTFGVRLSAAAVLDKTLVAVVPTIKSDPDNVLTTIVRLGLNDAGLVLAAPDYIPPIGFVDKLFAKAIYIPPGQFLTVMHLTANVALTVSLGFAEIVNP